MPGCFPYVSGGVFPISVSGCVSRLYRVSIHVYQSVSECIVGNSIHPDTVPNESSLRRRRVTGHALAGSGTSRGFVRWRLLLMADGRKR